MGVALGSVHKSQKRQEYLDAANRRRMEVLRLIVVGRSNAEIALEFGCTERAVTQVVYELYRKCGIGQSYMQLGEPMRSWRIILAVRAIGIGLVVPVLWKCPKCGKPFLGVDIAPEFCPKCLWGLDGRRRL